MYFVSVLPETQNPSQTLSRPSLTIPSFQDSAPGAADDGFDWFALCNDFALTESALSWSEKIPKT